MFTPATVSALIASVLLVFSPASTHNAPIWARFAIPFNPSCNAPESQRQRFKSPDGATVAELRCHTAVDDADSSLYLHVILPSGRVQDVELQPNSPDDELQKRPQELLWAPDSKALFVNGSENAYAGFFIDVYQISSNHVEKADITQPAQADMVKTFPPCAAAKRDEQVCKRIEANPDFNMSGLTWVNGSSAVVVMAEVPCSSSYGGIMCQVLGYKIEVPSGRILQRMTARELKENWQKSMAWTLRIPDPPVYDPLLKQ